MDFAHVCIVQVTCVGTMVIMRRPSTHFTWATGFVPKQNGHEWCGTLRLWEAWREYVGCALRADDNTLEREEVLLVMPRAERRRAGDRPPLRPGLRLPGVCRRCYGHGAQQTQVSSIHCHTHHRHQQHPHQAQTHGQWRLQVETAWLVQWHRITANMHCQPRTRMLWVLSDAEDAVSRASAI